jgi:hypothetical protein
MRIAPLLRDAPHVIWQGTGDPEQQASVLIREIFLIVWELDR